jgi:SAM-dependent methyltransferase
MKKTSNHPGLPIPNAYELEYKYWPWGKLVNFVYDWLLTNAPRNSCIIDYMCGTGYLLHHLANKRTDISFYGCSITQEFIKHAHKNYINIDVQLKDALEYIPLNKPNIIIATGGIHHLDYSKQAVFIKKVASELSKNDTFIVGEEVINPFETDLERKLSVLKLSSSLIEYVINQNAPHQIIKAALELQNIDMFELGEYKLTLKRLKELMIPYFKIAELIKIWPDVSEEYGDYVLICKKK